MTRAADEASLIGRIAAGDETALRALFARHQIRVFRFILRLVRNAAVAEELTNEVFLEVWRNAGSYAGASSAATWILSIAHHRAVSSLRKRREESWDEDAAAALPDTDDDPEVAAQKADKGAILRRCLDALSPEHKGIIDLVYYHEMSISRGERGPEDPREHREDENVLRPQAAVRAAQGGGHRSRLAMSEQTAEEIEREEIEMLLPWYATGRLDRADRAKVESYLARHPQMSAQLDLIRAEREQTVLANEALGSPSADARDRLMASLPAARPASLAQTHCRQRAVSAVSDFLHRAHGARRSVGSAGCGGTNRRASRRHHQPRCGRQRRQLPDRVGPKHRRRHHRTRGLCGRCQGPGNCPAAGGIRRQHRGRPQARRRIQDQATDGGPVASGPRRAAGAAGAAARGCADGPAKQGLMAMAEAIDTAGNTCPLQAGTGGVPLGRPTCLAGTRPPRCCCPQVALAREPVFGARNDARPAARFAVHPAQYSFKRTTSASVAAGSTFPPV